MSSEICGRRIAIVIVTCFLFFVPSICYAGENDFAQSYVFKTKNGDYKLVVKRKADFDYEMTIERGRKILKRESGERDTGAVYFVFDRHYQEHLFDSPHKPELADLNGDGIPDLIIKTWNGGAHCCYTFDVYSLGPIFKEIWHFPARNGHLHIDFNVKRLPLLEIEDDTFAYYGGGFESEFPKVFLQWRRGAFRVALDKMRKPFNANEFEKKRQEMIEKANILVYDKPLVVYMLKLIYSGHAQQTWKFLDVIWPANQAGKLAGYRKDFLGQLHTSPFYADLKALNPGQLE